MCSDYALHSLQRLQEGIRLAVELTQAICGRMHVCDGKGILERQHDLRTVRSGQAERERFDECCHQIRDDAGMIGQEFGPSGEHTIEAGYVFRIVAQQD